jgi:hypothetical protein
MGVRPLVTRVALTTALIVMSSAAFARPVQLGGVACAKPPVLHCPERGCDAVTLTNGGPVVEPQTGRTYFLDYPCNLEPGEQVTVVLSLHGAGSYGNWQRHYFPLLDYVDKYRLVVATPYSPRRVWGAEDDGYLQNIITAVVEEIGRENVRALWLAGHSQGGLTSTRLVCSDFFKTKVDGFLSLSGGRVGGQAGRAANFGVPPVSGVTLASVAAALPAIPAGALTPPPPPTCDFSHIFATGEHEISALPSSSERAKMYGCAPVPKRRDLVDAKGGYVFDGSRQDPGSKAWGLLPRRGKAAIYTYDNCRDRRVVADVVRLDKGHTEGLEPRVTEELVKMLVAARGGKIQRGG